MKTADVAIAGAGIVGASIAWHVTRAGCRDVLMLEREASSVGGTARGREMNVRNIGPEPRRV